MARPQHNSNYKYILLQNIVYSVYFRISFVSLHRINELISIGDAMKKTRGFRGDEDYIVCVMTLRCSCVGRHQLSEYTAYIMGLEFFEDFCDK
jgi:hypothetical protein